jgi:hypothetical protein
MASVPETMDLMSKGTNVVLVGVPGDPNDYTKLGWSAEEVGRMTALVAPDGSRHQFIQHQGMSGSGGWEITRGGLKLIEDYQRWCLFAKEITDAIERRDTESSALDLFDYTGGQELENVLRREISRIEVKYDLKFR